MTASGRCAAASAAAARSTRRRRRAARAIGRGAGVAASSLPREHPRGVAIEVPAQRAIGERASLAGGVRVPLPDQRLVVQEIDRAFDEHRSRHAARGDEERLVDRGAEVGDALHARQVLDVRRDQRALVDVLQRAPPLQRRRRRAAQQHDRALRELRVLERADGVGDARAPP